MYPLPRGKRHPPGRHSTTPVSVCLLMHCAVNCRCVSHTHHTHNRRFLLLLHAGSKLHSGDCFLCTLYLAFFIVFLLLVFALLALLCFLATWTHVHVRYMSSSVRLSSVVCNVRAPYSGHWNFWQCFYAIWYLGHL